MATMYMYILYVYVSTLTGQELVYSDKDLALKALKKFSGARFKVFKTKTEAERFSLQPAEEICPSPWKANNGTGKVIGTLHVCHLQCTVNVEIFAWG